VFPLTLRTKPWLQDQEGAALRVRGRAQRRRPAAPARRRITRGIRSTYPPLGDPPQPQPLHNRSGAYSILHCERKHSTL